jgi:hypothetical protein
VSERALARKQAADASQTAVKDSFAPERQERNQSEQTASSESFLEVGTGTYAEPRTGFDFSRVPATNSVPVSAETPASALLVEDSAAGLAPGQMKKSEFLARLQTAVTRAAEEAMEGTGRTTKDCPYLEYWFGFYNRKDSAHIERAIHKYAPETASAKTAGDYIPMVAARVRRSVEVWARTGEITGVPEGLPMGLTGMGLLGSVGKLVSGVAGIFFKEREGGAKQPDDPRAVQAELGEGRPLESGVRSRMQTAFGMDFTHVRAHTDSTAAALSDRMNARAFTVGRHVAFGAGEYQPGTLDGDALIAHELAHVVQQRDAGETVTPMEAGDAGYNALEGDADKSAVGAMASLWVGTKGRLKNIAQYAIPRLRSGISLARCGGKKPAAKSAEKTRTGGTACPTNSKINQAKQRLKTTYGFAAVVEEGGACWTEKELEKAERALAMLTVEDRNALKGVILKRVKVSSCIGGDTKGCFKGSADRKGKRNDVLEMADEAFEEDKEIESPTTAKVTRFSGGKEIKTLPSEETFLHETGHAVESVEFRQAEAKSKKADYGLEIAIDEYNKLPDIKFGRTDWRNNAERRYVRAMGAVNDEIIETFKPVKGLGDEPTISELTNAATSVRRRLPRLSRAIAWRKKARGALPGSSTVAMDRIEQAQDAGQVGLRKILAAVEAFRDAKKRLRKKSAKIMVAGTVVNMPRRRAELIAMVDLKGIDVKKSKYLDEYPKDNWPHKPKELFADLFMMSRARPETLKQFDPDIARFYEDPIGPKGGWKRRVNRWIERKEREAARAVKP